MADKDFKTPKDDRKIANQSSQPADSVTNTRQNSSDVITPHSISASSPMQQQQNVQLQQITNNYRSQGDLLFTNRHTRFHLFQISVKIVIARLLLQYWLGHQT